MIVADASLVANLLIPGLDHISATAVLSRDPDWRAPALWPYELRSTLLKYIKAGVITESSANQLMTQAVPVMGFPSPDAASDDILAVAVALGLSAYDAAYVALAQELRVPLVTYDQKLIRAAAGIALSPAHFLQK